MYQPVSTISDALDNMASNDYVLPAIQREFVWGQEQICSLFDSVMQGYPFGEFLVWSITREKSADYRWYGFVRDYHQRDNPHCPDLGVMHDKALTAVLDGQQRLTAFNIGLRGSMSIKLPRKWWNSPDAFPRRVLALDLLAPSDNPDEEGNRYAFEFIDEQRIGHDGERLWFKVSEIRTMKTGPAMLKWIVSHALTADQQTVAFETLDRLYRVICVDSTVVCYEEKAQDLDRVLNIFIRRNSGGTVLSYSDLLLSIAVSQWTTLDARKEVHELVDELNRIGGGFNLSKDFVMKAGLMLTDIASVGFKVENFTHANMAVLENNWTKIREALIGTVQLIASFGFSSMTIRAQSALLPIAYYLYRQGLPPGFVSSGKYVEDRNAIRNWLTRSILKASGIWGSGLDTLLTRLRLVIKDANDGQFPAEKMRQDMAQHGKSLEFSPEEVEDLADMGAKDNRLFALLALLFPFIDTRNNLHIDHVFPSSRFTSAKLSNAGVCSEQIDTFRDCSDRIANLQLLDGTVNTEKQAMLPAEWLTNQFSDPQGRQHYCDQHCLGEVPGDIREFMEFYEVRRDLLQKRISELLDVT